LSGSAAAAAAAASLAAANPATREDCPAGSVGAFASRSPHRPNRIGISAVRLCAVRGNLLEIGGHDFIDGTPVLDIKPVMAEFQPRGGIRQPAWSNELMEGYW
jgi:tRNA (Thr-GGU) A37 N-methylase